MSSYLLRFFADIGFPKKTSDIPVFPDFPIHMDRKSKKKPDIFQNNMKFGTTFVYTVWPYWQKKDSKLSDQVILLYSAPLLVAAAREFTIKEPTVKIHILEKHVEVLDRQKHAFPGKGLGF